MALMTWNDALSVKVGEFDDQHKKLVNLVNNLHDAMKSGQGKEMIGKTLTALIDYTQKHFAAEERLMKQHCYPEYEEHKKEHNMLVLKVLDFKTGFEAGKAPLTQDVLTFLRDWVVKHIQGIDKKYGVFFNSKGVK